MHWNASIFDLQGTVYRTVSRYFFLMKMTMVQNQGFFYYRHLDTCYSLEKLIVMIRILHFDAEKRKNLYCVNIEAVLKAIACFKRFLLSLHRDRDKSANQKTTIWRYGSHATSNSTLTRDGNKVDQSILHCDLNEPRRLRRTMNWFAYPHRPLPWTPMMKTFVSVSSRFSSWEFFYCDNCMLRLRISDEFQNSICFRQEIRATRRERAKDSEVKKWERANVNMAKNMMSSLSHGIIS